MRQAKTAIELDNYLQETITVSAFSLQKKEFKKQEQWQIKNGALSHRSGGFFHVVGLVNQYSQEEHLVLFQPQSAFNGMLVCRHGDEVYVMIQARIEPGNSGICQYGPTIQSTPANYMKLHGGKSTPYLDLFFGYSPVVKVLSNSTQYDLGKRYYQKSKTLSYLEVNELVDTEENMIWVALSAIRERLTADNYFNTDLRSMFGVFDWDEFSQNQTGDLSLPAVEYTDTFSTAPWRMTGVDQLVNWDITSTGIEGEHTSVHIYDVSCTNREVANWSQPLFDSKAAGYIVLYMRDNSGRPEFMLQKLEEFGISTGYSYSPSVLTYPEESKPEPQGKLLKSMTLSEEGGRFYKDENVYEVRQVFHDFPKQKNQFWVTVQEFKSVLKSSNLASIQLRVISSLVLDELNVSLHYLR